MNSHPIVLDQLINDRRDDLTIASADSKTIVSTVVAGTIGRLGNALVALVQRDERMNVPVSRSTATSGRVSGS